MILCENSSTTTILMQSWNPKSKASWMYESGTESTRRVKSQLSLPRTIFTLPPLPIVSSSNLELGNLHIHLRTQVQCIQNQRHLLFSILHDQVYLSFKRYWKSSLHLTHNPFLRLYGGPIAGRIYNSTTNFWPLDLSGTCLV